MGFRRWVISILALLLACGVATSFAQGGPPLITDDPDTPGNHRWEINVGFTQESIATRTNFEIPLFDFNYGAGDHLQLKFQFPYALQTGGPDAYVGLGNSQAGVKWRFLDEDHNGVSMSTYPQFTFTSSGASVREGLAESGWQMFLPIETSKSFGKFQVDAEAGYNIQQRLPNEVWLGLIGALHASSRVTLLTELHSIESGHFNQNESVFDLGSTIKLTELNTLLFAAGSNLPGSTGGQPKFFMFAGIQFNFLNPSRHRVLTPAIK